MKSTIDLLQAIKDVSANPSMYAQRAQEHALRITTPGRKRQAVIAAGRNALAEAIFKNNPELRGNFSKLTKAIRAQLGEDFNFEELNISGARALGFDL